MPYMLDFYPWEILDTSRRPTATELRAMDKSSHLREIWTRMRQQPSGTGKSMLLA
eukprot:CAMPEP_0197689610 /NCGR_PEP_ID=MMETSP1338-20131121/107143_1 /TAXON_ID=43686 ORGANISM="Pelagodinium beii, Strain RCC1491" /NCGR_SAMPLE_ID=MMETSP1338 /ASSEMBLY_ACC=CAM_ASM_000754 /LENGTH=54 /DNA_ID=CAMNT_0043271969 /DNA_START=80 /DNA_END=241 /DNA_ORIENTATION=-